MPLGWAQTKTTDEATGPKQVPDAAADTPTPPASASEDPFAPGPFTKPPKLPAESPTVPLQDPTQPSPTMRALLAPVESGTTVAEFPSLILKARLVGGLGPARAVLGLEEELYRVQEGSELTLTGSRWAGQQFRVVEISPEAVRLESVPGGRSWALY
jgi:hypothetical protein